MLSDLLFGIEPEGEVSQFYEALLRAVHLIPIFLAPGHPPLSDEVSALLYGRSKIVEQPEGAFAGLPAEIWRIIFEKLCPVSTSLIVAPSVVARDISNAQLVCRNFYSLGVIAWRVLGKLVTAEAGNFAKPEAVTSWTATKDLLELDMHRCVLYTLDCPSPVLWSISANSSFSVQKVSLNDKHRCRRSEAATCYMPPRRSFSDDDIQILQLNISWENILSNPQLYSQDGLDKASKCNAVEQNFAALQLYLTLRGAAQHVFGLLHPCAVPAVILLAVKHEKASAATDVCKFTGIVRDVVSAVKVVARHLGNTASDKEPSAFHFRRLIHSHGRTLEELLQLAADLRRNASADEEEQPKESCCDCGNSAAARCTYGCCNICCPRPCEQHTKVQVRLSQPLVWIRVASSKNVFTLKRKQDVVWMEPDAISVRTLPKVRRPKKKVRRE